MRSRPTVRWLASVASASLLALAASCDGPTAPNAGVLEVILSGLPAGATASVVLEDEDGALHTLSGPSTLDALPIGLYTVTVGPAFIGLDQLTGVAPDTVRIRGGGTATLLVRYSYATGGVSIGLQGLLATDTATIGLESPAGDTVLLRVPANRRGLPAGRYRLLLDTLTRRGERFDPVDSQFAVVLASDTLTRLAARYLPTTGSLALRAPVLPGGTRPLVRVFHELYGGNRLDAIVPIDTVIRGLAPGLYRIVPQPTPVGSFYWYGRHSPGGGDPMILVTASPEPVIRDFEFTLASGAVRLDVRGLPPGARPVVKIEQDGGAQIRTLKGDTLQFVMPGTWVITPALFSVDGVPYGMGASDTVTVTMGAVAEGVIEFVAQTDPIDISIGKTRLTQAIQTDSGTVPLVAGRDAFLYAEVRADRENAFAHAIRVRLHDAGAVIFDTTVIKGLGIPGTEWVDYHYALGLHIKLPGEHLRPGVGITLESDPDGVIPDVDPSNDRFPASGEPLPLDIRSVPPFRARFVPVQFTNSGAIARIAPERAADLIARSRTLLPLGSVEWDIRAPFQVAYPKPSAYDGETWVNVVSLLDVLRAVEGGDRHYVGILDVDYGTGIAGIGALPGKVVAIWDWEVDGVDVFSHELGHNFGRLHGPGCDAGGVDPDFPREDGSIGDWGFSAWRGFYIMPRDKDVMTYCAPHHISAYTSEAIREFRDAAAAGIRSTEVVLVSGRMSGGRIALDPAFVVPGFASPASGGRHRVELLDQAGRVILTRRFDMQALSDEGNGTELFTLAIPVADLGGRAVARVRVVSGAAQAELQATASGVDGARITATRGADGTVEIDGRGSGARGLIVRDPATGEILAIVRGNVARIRADGAELDVVASDGLRSIRTRLRPGVR